MLWGNDNKKRCKPSKNGLQRSFLAPPAGFEPVACRLGGDRSIQLSYGGLYRKYSIMKGSRIRTIRFLGELLNNCHTCSPVFKKASNHQAFFTFRIASCSPKFTVVVRCLPAQISSFLDFAKKGKKNNFHLPPILAVLSAKIQP